MSVEQPDRGGVDRPDVGTGRGSGPEPLLVAAVDEVEAPPPDFRDRRPAIRGLPRIPVMVDERQIDDPGELAAQGPLHFVALRDGNEALLSGYKRRDAMLSAAAEFASSEPRTMLMSASLEHVCQWPPDNLPETVCFFEHIWEGGDVGCLAAGRAYQNLTKVGRSKILWWYSSDWNDVISSVSWCRYGVSLFEHIDYQGSELYLQAGCNTPNLVDLGWNDRASSVVNWGR